MNIDVTVKNKVATAPSNTKIICGNNDYVLTFLFDEEWEAESKKTARFVWFRNNKSSVEEVEFTGRTVNVPILSNTYAVYVGVYAGSLRTTTAAKIICEPSILCYGTDPAKTDNTALARLQGLVNQLMAETLTQADITRILDAYVAAHPPLHGKDGKDGYTPQKYIDYWTEEDKAEMMGSFKVLTDSEIELLNAMLTEDTLISSPAMVASYTAGYRDPVEPGGLRQHYCDVTATVTNISRALIAKAEVGWKVSTGSIVDVWEWHDAEITFGDTEHTVSYTHVSEYVRPYSGLAVKLTYYSLIGGENELIAEAVYNG